MTTNMNSQAVLLGPDYDDIYMKNNAKMTYPKEDYDDEEDREKWTNKLDFIFSCVGYAIGLGNVWRFPYLCFKNGGGAFLIPYGIALIFGGIPMFFLEVSIGQYMSRGGIGIWGVSPILKGVGYATTLMAFWLNTSYIVVLAWALYYLYMSFTDVLPWDNCNNWWNTKHCVSSTGHVFNATVNQSVIEASKSSVVEFWEYNVLQKSNSLAEVGAVRWELALTLGLAWLACYFCIFKGIKWTGRIVYFTSTFPYVLLTILLVKGLMLEGAMNGIKFLFIPDWSLLKKPQVWIDAVTQVFYSYGLGIGAITGLGSYNKYKNNCYKDTIVLSILNEGTCFLAAIVIFSVLGFLSHVTGKDIADVATGGPGLAFVTYPSALTQLPISPLWSILFFLMLIFIGLDSQFCAMEGFVTAITDEWTFLKKHRSLFLASACLLSYGIGISFVTEGGVYVFVIFNEYACAGWAMLCMMFFQCIGVSWFYGIDRFYDNLKDMIGYYPPLFWKYCWFIFTPLLCVLVFIFSFFNVEPFMYGDYLYPWYGQYAGWLMALSAPSLIPLYALYKTLTNKGSFKDIIKPRYNKNERESKSYEIHYSHGISL